MKSERYSPTEFTNFRTRVQFLAILVMVGFGLLFFRLWFLQILSGQFFKELSENNRLRHVRLPSRRGRIYDRNGVPLATSRPAFDLFLVRQDVKDLDYTLKIISERLNLAPDRLRQKVIRFSPYLPLLIQRDIKRNDVAFFEEQKFDLPGVKLEVEPIRHYLYGKQVAHLLGYLGEVSESQLNRDRKGEKIYRPGDLIGKTGIEFMYDRELRGQNGFKQIEVDAHGQEMTVLRKKESTPGHDFYLTINWKLQRLAYELLGDQAGSIVALDPRNGEVLVLVNSPAFDPNDFVSGLKAAQWKALRENPKKPLQNRALQGQYPPGSVFKIIVAIAGLEEGMVHLGEELFCPGSYYFGKRIYHDWKRGGHGRVNLMKALEQSCDVYFYQLGQRLGVDLIAKYAKGFGLGRATGITLPNEQGGLVPSSRWKKRRFNQPWYPGETLSVAIGQGYNLVTPIQQAQLISAVASRGTVYEPLIVKRVTEYDHTIVNEAIPTIVGYLPAQPQTLAVVRSGLRAVVNAKHGTGWRAKMDNVIVAGKTGTSQVVRLNPEHKSMKPEEIPERFRDHSWFVAFAPFEEPTIAIAIFAEHSGIGGSRFAPFAKQLIAAHLGTEQQATAQRPQPPQPRPVTVSEAQ